MASLLLAIGGIVVLKTALVLDPGRNRNITNSNSGRNANRNTTAGRFRDFLLIGRGYLAAVAAAAATVIALNLHPLLEVLIADLMGTLVIFVFSLRFRNASFYDAYWSVAPPLIAIYFTTIATDAVFLRQLLVLIVVTLWAVRLTGNWAYGWQGMQHEDWRYRSLAESSGRLWWLLSLTGVHLFPTAIVYLGCIALYPALSVGAGPLGWMDGLAFAIGLAAVWLEFQADRELHRFRARRVSQAEVLAGGVWAWCRHPNYLGEIGFWVSVYLFGLAAWPGSYPWSWLGPVSMVLLFVGISIPMIERKLLAEKPGYAAYCTRTRMLIPRLL
jgi:steroid 5-alpha reductase family enzyme